MHSKPVSLLIILFFLSSILLPILVVHPIGAQTANIDENVPTLMVHLPVPFYYQSEDYYCGPACLQMVFNYYGENVSQYEIAAVARSIGDPYYVTFTDELRRAGHFSNVSTSMGNGLLPQNITGYTLRSLGYSASENHGMSLATLETYLDQGKPLILLMWYSQYHVSTHFRVATGYNQTHVFVYDPWNKPLWGGTYGGPNIAFNNTEFLDLWSYYNNWALYVSPWAIDISSPAQITPGTPFQLESTIVYPKPLPNALSQYPASFCNASISLPANLTLAPGEVEKKPVGTGLVNDGDNAVVTWMLVATSSFQGTLNITVEGTVSGDVGAHYDYPSYSYFDRIGVTASFAVKTGESMHAVNIANVTAQKTVVGQGYPINITVTTDQLSTENSIVAANASSTIIGTQILNSTMGRNNLTFVWNTSDFTYGNYTLTAHSWPVAGEQNLTNNMLADGSVLVTIPGDINGDFKVSLQDLVLLAKAYDSELGGAKWNPNADIDNNGIAGLPDLVIMANHYLQHYP